MRFGRLYPGNQIGYSNSIPKYMVWRENQVFESMTLFGEGGPGMNLGEGDRPQPIKTLRASEGPFWVFGVSPLIGHTYSNIEDVPADPRWSLSATRCGRGAWAAILE